MTIKEYFYNYSENSKFDQPLITGNFATVQDFYDGFVKHYLLDPATVIAWHKMLVDYANDSKAILWARYYESGSKKSGRWDTRRACFTKFQDGFSYVFVSNYDVHEIFNMVRKGIVPNKKEFLDLMTSFDYPMHYDRGQSCEESFIAKYTNSIGSVHGGILTKQKLYLAHIEGLKEGFYLDKPLNDILHDDKLTEKERDHIFPRGLVQDWDSTTSTRHLDYSLTYDEKAIVKAHFLRFVDPLNYFLTPSGDNHTHSWHCGKSNIGECKPLCQFVKCEFTNYYGSNVMDEFNDLAMVNKKPISQINSLKNTAVQLINVNVSNAKLRGKLANSLHAVTKPSTHGSRKPNQIAAIARKTLLELHNNGLLDQRIINDLLDKNYSKKNFNINYPVLSKTAGDRYYVNELFQGYRLCREWFAGMDKNIYEWKEKIEKHLI